MSSRVNAFSLVEVVVALGIFAFAIVALLGLLVPITQSASDVTQNDYADRVVMTVQSALEQEYRRQAALNNSAAAYNYFVGLIGVADAALFASQDGSKIGNPTTLPVEQRFFAVRLKPLPNYTLSLNDSKLAFNVELSWPAYLPDGTQVPLAAQQSKLIVPVAFLR